MRHVSTALRSRFRQVSLDDVSTISTVLVKHWYWNLALPNVLHANRDSIRLTHSHASRSPEATDLGSGLSQSGRRAPLIRRISSRDINIPLSSQPQPPRVPPPISAPRAARHLGAPLKQAPKLTTHARSLNVQYQASPVHPRANIGLPQLTRNVAMDIYHPLNIFATRRLDDWSLQSFKWNIRVDISVSKKAVVRNWVRRRVQAAMRERLEARGWGVNGEVLAAKNPQDEGMSGETTNVQKSRGQSSTDRATTAQPQQNRQLEGALLVVADQSLITASFPDVKEKVESMLDWVVQKQRLHAAEQKNPWKQRSFVRRR
ncbi:hypothetical protein BDZ85DRAFT_253924 [Elsinoe ampelina]|uniref:Uncharacterized protein n=1 Tax=Elsinoe ampelina TaxID=302913 RepID=A0A6A6GNB0_9PEZI|nr:hypothetical protein BDZ85DRAFT_253924 [Elsinoe ampelina]